MTVRITSIEKVDYPDLNGQSEIYFRNSAKAISYSIYTQLINEKDSKEGYYLLKWFGRISDVSYQRYNCKLIRATFEIVRSSSMMLYS